MGVARQDVLVTTEWVATHGQDPGVRLVEVDVDTEAYKEGHIEGAVAWNWTTQLQDRVRRDIIGRDELQELLRASGIRNDDLIVLYGDNNNWFAAYAYWILTLYGHRRLKLMDGGRKKWILEGRPLTQAVPTYPRSDYVVGPRDETYRARRQVVLERLADPGVALVDVRSPAEYRGEILAPPGLAETAQRPGHIPGAKNIPWSEAVNEDGTFKSDEELRALYAARGITPDKDVIAYCRIGERSSHTWFVLKELLEFPSVRNYDGSWTEWGSMIDMPIEI
jgi:thiosulfate/3-mercaptopyruvate sulfurtransferase